MANVRCVGTALLILKHAARILRFQEIYARTIMPCMDTPAVKFTYSAKVTAPKEVAVLMSAVINESKKTQNADATTTHYFEQKVL